MPWSLDRIDPAVRRGIEDLLDAGVSGALIARELRVHPMMVSAIKRDREKRHATASTPQTSPAAPQTSAATAEPRRKGLAEYRRYLRRHLPLRERARILADAARAVAQDPANALRALQHIDSLEGLAKAGQESQPQAATPLFILPPGAQVAID